MPTSFESLRDDDVGAICFEPTGFGDSCRGAENDAVGVFESPNRYSLWQTKMETDDSWSKLEDEVESFVVERRKRFTRGRHQPQPKFVEVGC